jgi:uncharacterized protein YhaN
MEEKMFFIKLDIKGFGKLKNVQLSFKKGLNLIYGYNEAGKSTLQQFIKGTIYGLSRKKTNGNTLSEYEKYKPWDNYVDFKGNIEYKLENGESYTLERDFRRNRVIVYDNDFANITNTFGYNKNTRDIMVGETHFGVNRASFEKISYIKQLETNLGKDNSGELLNKISNVYQSGFEDISPTNIKDIIKATLLNYVGTSKTSIRPLNIVSAKIEELSEARSELLNIKKDVMKLEYDLKKITDEKNQKEREHSILEEKISIIKLKEKMDKNEKSIENLDEIYNSCKMYENKLLSMNNKIKELEKEIDKNSKYSAYDNEDVENMMIAFYEQLGLEKELNVIKSNIDKNINSINNIKNNETYKNFNCNDYKDLEGSFSKLEILEENIKKDKEIEEENRNDVEKYIKFERTLLRSTMGLVTLSFLLVLFRSILDYNIPIGLFVFHPITVTVLISYIVFSLKKNKKGTKLNDLFVKSIQMKNGLDNMEEEYNNLEESVENIYETLKVSNYKDFIIKRKEFKNLENTLSITENELVTLEHEYAMESRKVKLIQNSIREILFSVGIIKLNEEEIYEDHVREFKQGVIKLKEIEPNIKFIKQRIDDIKNSIDNYKEQTKMICEIEIEHIDSVTDIIENLKCEKDKLKNQFEELTNNSKYKEISDKLLNDDSINVEELENNLNKIYDEITNLKIKEKELTISIDNLSFKDDELQKIEGEIKSYEERKNKLEIDGKALQLALELMEESCEEVKKDFVPKLNEKVGKYSKLITEKRYDEVKVQDNLNIMLKSSEANSIINLEYLSLGTIDQLYFALRLAMADFILINEKLPLIIDEAFSLYDDNRITDLVKLLNNISNETQLILFTCKKSEVDLINKYCDNVNYIDLNELAKKEIYVK